MPPLQLITNKLFNPAAPRPAEPQLNQGGRPIYYYDNKGERQYVDDENLKATITAAEKRVVQDCH